jgi:conflict system STAND superfamily ATPase
VDLLLQDVEGEPGALALLSHALRETWLRREGRVLTVAGYWASGGIRGAVARTAEEIYEHVPDDQRPLLRDLMLRLVSAGVEGEPVRTRAPRWMGRVLSQDGRAAGDAGLAVSQLLGSKVTSTVRQPTRAGPEVLCTTCVPVQKLA